MDLQSQAGAEGLLTARNTFTSRASVKKEILSQSLSFAIVKAFKMARNSACSRVWAKSLKEFLGRVYP